MEGVTAAAGRNPDYGTAFSTAGRLLGAARSKQAAGRKRNPFPPLVNLLANIFFCAYFQRFLADDPDGVYLPLFITVECLAGVLISLSFVGGPGAEILMKTRFFPGSSTAGYYFLVSGSLMRPELFLFAAAGCAFPAFAFAPGSLPAAGMIALMALCFLAAQVLCCAASVRLIRSSLPVAGLVVAAVAAMAAVTASVFVFPAGALASSLPMAGWAASGISAFSAGDTAGGLECLGYTAAAAAALVIIFRK